LTWSLSGQGSWELAFHVYLGLVLVLGTIGLLVAAVVAATMRWIVTSAVAVVFTPGAFFNGLAFVDFAENANSMVMATAWLISVGSLVSVCLTTAPTAKVQPR
jgi:hypothetical protein